MADPIRDLSQGVVDEMSPAGGGLGKFFAAMDPMQLLQLLQQMMQPKQPPQIPDYNQPQMQRKPSLKGMITGEY